ncbi:hypothetical protein GCM10011583_43610 [Streptomyces camponoticapitis]|uniref:Uncharacterized protein n=1 Tax=Streptomyces camponoticapitis TaxID=1616125 RepID=A0ABQ2EGI9_9ACTN|nr:hypothetical protein GCM10011583_43610 [Streptomyces camponoticapitis]
MRGGLLWVVSDGWRRPPAGRGARRTRRRRRVRSRDGGSFSYGTYANDPGDAKGALPPRGNYVGLGGVSEVAPSARGAGQAGL